ncbi:MAG: amidohydrolase family protein [Synergistales bacterium]|nr:amidohydrolase family protein [Synergistales bacterium]
MSLGIGGGPVADGAEVFLSPGALLVEDGKVAETGSPEEIRSKADEYIDTGGRLILPGLVNFHSHFYSALAPGLIPAEPPKDLPSILRGLWWRLDMALDRESIAASALTGAAEAARHGVTTVFDHHASMQTPEGSLETIAGELRRVGIRGCLCYEITDRAGTDQVARQIEENVEFARRHRDDPFFKGTMGLHASLTLSEDTLQAVSAAGDLPVHIHCGEGAADLARCQTEGYAGPVDRLHRHGLLSRDAILVHCIHLSPRDREILADLDPVVVTNPESNANNGVGHFDGEGQPRFVLGTDGMSQDMTASLKSLFLMAHPALPLERLQSAFFPQRIERLQRWFPETGTFAPGSDADVAVLDYIPLTPISRDSLAAHLVFGAKGGDAWLTLCGGEVVWRQGMFTSLNWPEEADRIGPIAAALHHRFYAQTAPDNWIHFGKE